VSCLSSNKPFSFGGISDYNPIQERFSGISTTAG